MVKKSQQQQAEHGFLQANCSQTIADCHKHVKMPKKISCSNRSMSDIRALTVKALTVPSLRTEASVHLCQTGEMASDCLIAGLRAVEHVSEQA